MLIRMLHRIITMAVGTVMVITTHHANVLGQDDNYNDACSCLGFISNLYISAAGAAR
jgi:hypothetical protein